VAAGIALALVVTACTGAGATPVPTASPAAPPTDGPDGGACTSAPEPDDLTGWDVSSQTPTFIPQLISQVQTCGQNRILFSFIDRQASVPVAAPDRPVTVAFYDLARDPMSAVSSGDAQFLWAIEDERGLYVVNAEFGEAGVWGAEFTFGAPDGSSETTRLAFTVRETSPTRSVGNPAPASVTPTAADVGGDLSLLSTDDEPVPAFYETSVDEALAAHEPFVLVFATPKFCVSAQCGPTLDRVKPVAAANPNVTFINVEPYELQIVDGQLQPVITDQNLTPVPSVLEWGILSEPWVFVVDGDGIITGSLDLIFSEAELQAAIDRATAP
jgi:hypothetical protein